VTPDEVTFDGQGLIPAVVQEADTGELLMVAWMDRAALDATLETGLTHFWSRSRGKLWRKGETSGHTQHVRGLYVDCDGDTLLVQVHQDGPACHTGNRTCFFRALAAGAAAHRTDGALERGPTAPSPTMLGRLEKIVASRKTQAPTGSYVAGLLGQGEAAVCRKIGEEAVEVVTAALGGEGDGRIVEEIADLWFHTMVLLGQRDIPLADVLKELARRHARREAASG
jgi:phosphoribosyl-AMP cyclohydrolase / phosphoribosyl-ATP pyrophosphohydrolase